MNNLVKAFVTGTLGMGLVVPVNLVLDLPEHSTSDWLITYGAILVGTFIGLTIAESRKASNESKED